MVSVYIRPLASSSMGNSYRVSDGDTALLLEAGIPYNRPCANLERLLRLHSVCAMAGELERV